MNPAQWTGQRLATFTMTPANARPARGEVGCDYRFTQVGRSAERAIAAAVKFSTAPETRGHVAILQATNGVYWLTDLRQHGDSARPLDLRSPAAKLDIRNAIADLKFVVAPDGTVFDAHPKVCATC